MTRTGAKPGYSRSDEEFEILRTKYDKKKLESHELREDMRTARQKGSRLANGMGFKDIDEALQAVHENPLLFDRTSVEKASSRIQVLQKELEQNVRHNRSTQADLAEMQEMVASLRNENEDLSAGLEVAQNQVGRLKMRVDELENARRELEAQLTTERVNASAAAQDTERHKSRANLPADALDSDILSAPPVNDERESKSESLRRQLSALQTKYNALRAAKRRTDAQYKDHYGAWRKFKHWMVARQSDTASAEELRMKYHEMIQKFEIRDAEPEQSVLMTPPTTDRNAVASTSGAARMAGSPFTVHADESAHDAHGPGSPSNLSAARTSFKPLQPKPSNLASAQSPSPSPSPLRKIELKRTFEEMASSSDTEDDSQAPDPVYHTQAGLVLVPSTVQRVRQEQVETGLPSPALSTPGLAIRHSKNNATEDATPSRPLKLMPKRSPKSSKTPVARGSKACKENVGSSNTGKHHPKDYSIYKGRGRYATSANAGKATINAQYQIDSAQNGGLDFQFNESVRNKRQRMQLDAIDCQHCHDYYEAIGQLPPRLQAPLWRSPESTPSKPSAHRCTHNHLDTSKHATTSTSQSQDDFGIDDTANPVAEHKQEISRHRAQWEPGKTPPQYWNIGFPDTQEVAVINARAEEMHAQKAANIEAQARRGRKYKRR
ncbi:hypothetical protein B0H21DRAFT_60883 [Amylocystis lapponica]|nr:hypothetical protein B0H21DRAFT_60883 [Amylocystis lapponica]